MFPTLMGHSMLEVTGIGFALALTLSPFVHPLLNAYFVRLLGESDEPQMLEPLVVYGAVGAAAGLLLPACYGTTPLSGLGPGCAGGVAAYAITLLAGWARAKTIRAG